MRLQFQGVKWNLVVIIGLFALQFVGLLFLAYLRRRLTPDGTETLRLYHEYSLNLLQGQVPYRDFPMEYPPLALLPMVIPQLVKLGQMVHFLPEYEWFFMLENILLSIVVGLILVWVVLRWKLRQHCVIFLAFVGVIITCLICFQNERLKKGAITDESLLVFIVVALLTFIVAGKVFSPQYIIWLLPFAPLLRPRQVGLLIAISTISIVIYPFLYDELIAMQTFPVMLLNLRNSLVGILLFWLVVERLLNSGQKIDKPTHSA